MKRFVVILAIAVGALALASPAGAQFNCHNWTCVNRVLNVQQKQINVDTQAVATLAGTLGRCLQDLPVSQYGGSGSGGYIFDTTGASTFIETSALDVTQPGDQVGAWLLADTCNTTQTAALARAHQAHRLRPVDPMAPFSPFGWPKEGR